MDYVKKFLHVEGIIGQGAFGRVLVTSPLQNQLLPQLVNGHQSPPLDGQQLANVTQEDGLTRHKQQVHSNKLPNKLNSDTNGANGARFALKCVHPILRPQRLANELRHLRDLGGQCNVVQMHTAHFYMGSLYIVMELIEHDRFLDFVAQLDYNEIVMYMKNLLVALEHVHAHSIMHRDIKPANFLFNRKDKKFLLVDFGLAQIVRTRSALFGNNKPNPSSNTSSYASSLSLLSSPTTPTIGTPGRRLMAPLFPELHDKDNQQQLNHIKANAPFVSLKSSQIIHQSPARRYINLTPTGSPIAPNMSTKRQHLPEVSNSNDFNQMLKKLRVSNNDDIREPVKLTVGAYESPITHNDSLNRRTVPHHKFSTPTVPSRRSLSAAKCDCRGKPKTCTTCSARPDSNAPKSGTPGFKAPEILLRHSNQTTAIDMWSAGVILACLLSGHSPFFRDVDDNVSLAEIITILGSHKVIQAAKALGIRLNVEPKREPVDLMQLCKKLRQNNKDKRQIDIPDEAYDLLNRMLDPNPLTRITASEALKHPWLLQTDEVA